ncbi:MAG: hypothetical protein ACM31P_13165 [Actinomycetota bacterium]
MAETIEFTSRIFGRYIEMHARLILQSLEVAEAMNNGVFAVCRVALKNSEESCCGGVREAR